MGERHMKRKINIRCFGMVWRNPTMPFLFYIRTFVNHSFFWYDTDEGGIPYARKEVSYRVR